MMSAACTTTIIPPDPKMVREPVEVILLTQGYHSSLVLPANGQVVRYAYGDWAWYARQQYDPLTMVAALLLPSQATLGRSVMPGPLDADHLQDSFTVAFDRSWIITVERSRVQALRDHLDELHRRHGDTAIDNEAWGLTFVHHPCAYSYFHNSNHAVAHWLSELGCTVRGPAFTASWVVNR